MGFLEKGYSEGYSPLRDELYPQSARDSDEIMHERFRHPKPKRSRRAKRICIAVGGLVFLAFYSVLLVGATLMYWKKDSFREGNMIDILDDAASYLIRGYIPISTNISLFQAHQLISGPTVHRNI
ncbi:hypothetical protein PG993_004782 [Apiospora rasikravindrae]|uniref:Uncharacterized protein n=1 Tax=Apiospora rasikravindrae TaxID=990691 RepID=A0ABR1TDQ6_9PEZI